MSDTVHDAFLGDALVPGDERHFLLDPVQGSNLPASRRPRLINAGPCNQPQGAVQSGEAQSEA